MSKVSEDPNEHEECWSTEDVLGVPCSAQTTLETRIWNQ